MKEIVEILGDVSPARLVFYSCVCLIAAVIMGVVLVYIVDSITSIFNKRN